MSLQRSAQPSYMRPHQSSQPSSWHVPALLEIENTPKSVALNITTGRYQQQAGSSCVRSAGFLCLHMRVIRTSVLQSAACLYIKRFQRHSWCASLQMHECPQSSQHVQWSLSGPGSTRCCRSRHQDIQFGIKGLLRHHQAARARHGQNQFSL